VARNKLDSGASKDDACKLMRGKHIRWAADDILARLSGENQVFMPSAVGEQGYEYSRMRKLGWGTGKERWREGLKGGGGDKRLICRNHG
jgi:hypothetical protein